jgi:hypothetical protein
MTRAAASSRPGIALLTALVVVLLLTLFLSELFFATGLELRSLESFKDSAHARRLARSVLKATEIGLLQDEVDFFASYRQLQQLLAFSSVPLEGGRLVTLDITPVDSLFNLNDIAGLRPESALNRARFQVFSNLMAQIMVPAENAADPAEPPPAAIVSGLYAALMDWLDSDDVVNDAPDGAPGAETGAYFRMEPEYAAKNALLERLEEIRLLQGFEEARLPWPEVEKRFIVRAKSAKNELFPEKLNVNLASRQEIIQFLAARHLETALGDGSLDTTRKAINTYAERAQEVASALVPEGAERPVYTAALIVSTLNTSGLDGKASSEVFSSISQHYRVKIVTEVGSIQAQLTALVYVNRNASDRTGKSAEVLEYHLN